MGTLHKLEGNAMAAWKERQGLNLTAKEKANLQASRLALKKAERETDPPTVKTEIQMLASDIKALRQQIADGEMARSLAENARPSTGRFR